MLRTLYGFLTGVVFSTTLLLDGYSRPAKTPPPTQDLPPDNVHMTIFGITAVSGLLAASLIVLVATAYIVLNMHPRLKFHTSRAIAPLPRFRHSRKFYTARHIRREPAETGLASISGYH